MVEGVTYNARRAGLTRTILWVALGLALLLSVLIINGGPLYYFDSGGYLDNGVKALRAFGVDLNLRELQNQNAPLVDGDETVNGSRSIVYSIFTTLTGLLAGMSFIPVLHAALVLFTLWIALRIVLRAEGLALDPVATAIVAILVASFSSLPFYIAYVMPDIMLGLMLIVIAVIGGYANAMRAWEIVVLIALGSFAVTSHLSHVAISALMVPGVALVLLIFARRRWWLPTLLVALIPLAGFAERAAFRTAVETVSHADVVYYPFITARLIQDGVGYQYLQEVCETSDQPTCLLYQALQRSDNPRRLTASHIIFERSEDLGSFRLMDQQDQASVSRAQSRFFRNVLKAHPFLTARALLRNTLLQSRMVSVNMTIPESGIFERLNSIRTLPEGLFQIGRLSTDDRSWIGNFVRLQKVGYVVALAVLVGLVFSPRLPRHVRVLALVIVGGIVANAFVCGALSQPADRYGARAAWLVPVFATIVAMIWWRKRAGAMP